MRESDQSYSEKIRITSPWGNVDHEVTRVQDLLEAARRAKASRTVAGTRRALELERTARADIIVYSMKVENYEFST